MKNKSILLLLPATMLLASCGNEPGSSYKEVDKQTVATSAKKAKEEVAKDAFSFPKKLTLTASGKVSGKDKENDGAANFSVSASFDAENKYFHVSSSGDVSSLDNNAIASGETWIYKKDNSFVVASLTGENKGYVELASEAQFDEEFGQFEKAIDLDEDSLKDAAKAIYDNIIAAATSLTGSGSVEVNGTKAESSYKFFKGDGDGDIKMEYLYNFSSSDYSYSLENKFVTTSYLPALTSSKKTGNINGAAFSSELKTTYDWDKCDLKYPDLSSFTKQNS